MFTRELDVQRIRLYYSDTALKGSQKRYILLSAGLKKALKVYDDFLWKKNHLGPGLANSVDKVELNLTLCGPKKIRTLNRVFRAKDKVTDVLSFQLHEELGGGGMPSGQKILNLGDLFICTEVAKRQAQEFNIGFVDELLHLLTHGFLHLCGFDHEHGINEEKEMQLREDYLISKISKIKG